MPAKSEWLLRPTILAAFLLFATITPPAFASEKEEQAKLDALKSRIQAVQQQLAKTTGERDKQAAQLRETELAAARLRKKITGLEAGIQTLNRDIRMLETEQAKLEEGRREQAGQIARDMTTAYRLGREEPLKMLLNQEDPERISRLLKYYEYFLQARSKKLHHYLETIARLEQVKTTQRAKQTQLFRDRNNLKRQQSALQEQQSQRRQVLATLNKDLQTEDNRLRKLKKEQAQLEQILQTLRDSLQNLSIPGNLPFPQRKGKLIRPTQGAVLRGFGARRAANLPWQGWLLATREGEPVRAVHHGRVVFSDYLRGQGLLLIIDHGSGYLSLYAHNQVLLKDTGEWVQGGETVARAGDTGGLQESALYFEIRHNGKPLDPKPWLQTRR